MKKKKNNRPKSITNRLLTMMLFGIIVVYTLLLCFFSRSICTIKKDIITLRTEVDQLYTYSGEYQIDSDVSKYVEISDKADAEMDRLVSIVGILATAYTVFGALIVFKAPRDIDERLVSLDRGIDDAKHAAEEAEYQARIINVTLNKYNGEQTSYDRIKGLSQIIEEYPDRVSAYLVRAFEYDDIRKYDAAINDYSIVLKIQKDNASALNGMAVAYSKKSEHKKAIKLYSKAIAISEDADYLANRGSSYHDSDQIDLAIKDYKRALEIDDSCKAAYINRSVLYIDLMEKEDDTEKKEQLRQSAIDDLKSVLDIDKEDQMARAKLTTILRPAEETTIARIDEKIGDIEIAEKDHLGAWIQYAKAIVFYLTKQFKEGVENASDVDRIFRKMSAINSYELFSTINVSDDKLYDSFYNLVTVYASKKYVEGKKEYAEELFLYIHNIQNHGQYASLNLAYMKRRGETASTTYSLRDLLSECEDRQSIMWGINTALCYLDGVEDYERDWFMIINSLSECDNIDEAISWWGDTDVVGEQESNIVMLLLHLVPKVCFEDSESVVSRINLAIEHGYVIPDDIVSVLKDNELVYSAS